MRCPVHCPAPTGGPGAALAVVTVAAVWWAAGEAIAWITANLAVIALCSFTVIAVAVAVIVRGICRELASTARPMPPLRVTAIRTPIETRPATGRAVIPRGAEPPKQITIGHGGVSEYCTGKTACALCPGQGCACTCRHDPHRIVAANIAAYAKDHPQKVNPA